jgi:hypothetical protein
MHKWFLAFFFCFLLPCTVLADEPVRNFTDIGICANLHRLKANAELGYPSYRGELLDEGLSPYDSARSGYTKKRYASAQKILQNANSCEIWVADNPDIYQGPRYICHWDADHVDMRKERFERINEIFETCFNYGEFSCVDVYGPRKICFLKAARKGDTMIEWGEGIARKEDGGEKYFTYLSVYPKTTN